MTWIEQRINQPNVAVPSTGTRSKKKVRATRTDYDTDLLHDPIQDRAVPNTPEIALWRACLKQHLKDLSDSHPRIRREAREWIFDVNDDVRGFDWVCSILGLDSSYVRGMVRRKEEAE
jgi:hypothetical protein